MRYRISPPPAGPVQGILAAVAGVLVLAATVFFGFVVFLLALGALAVFGLYAWVRSRWGGGRGRQTGPAPKGARGGQDIEGEFTVVSRRRD